MNTIQDTEDLQVALRKLDNRLEDMAEISSFGNVLTEDDFSTVIEIIEKCRAFVGY